jgi:acetate---CoA ligase (ADP-forming)
LPATSTKSTAPSTGSDEHRFPDLRPLLSPRSIAVVGASDRPGAGSIVLDNIRQLGFRGDLYPVNPKYATLAGVPCYGSLLDVPAPIDCVAILVSSRQVLAVLEQAATVGARAAWVLANGFAETGPEGAALQRGLEEFASLHRMAVCGPNCVGTFNLHARSATYSVALPPGLSAGPVGGVFQSGAICLGVANSNRDLGFSALISSGNEAVLDSADYIAHLAGDPQTRIILAFLEGIKHPARFLEAARRARLAGKPLLVIKVGRSEIAQRAALAHTGMLAGSDRVHDAVFRANGIVRLDGLDELLEAAELFLKAPLPGGNGVGMLTLSGGQIGLIGDLMHGINVRFGELSDSARERLAKILPPTSAIRNPLDAWGSGNIEETYPACMNVMAEEESIALIAVSRDSPPGIAPREVWQSSVIVDAAARVVSRTGKPVAVISNIANGFDAEVQRRARAAGLPMLQGTRAGLRAVEALVHYAEHLRRPASCAAPRPLDDDAVEVLRKELAGHPRTLAEADAKRLLAAYGIPVTREEIARSPGDAVAIAAAIGEPVVLKIASPDVPHKTEAGAVALDVSGADAIGRACDRILKNVRRFCPQARVDGILVQEMVRDHVAEVIVGTYVDDEFGPVVVFGVGGIWTELVQDTALRLAPVSEADAHELVAEIRGAPLLRGFRGRPPADVHALVDTIVRLSHLAADLRDTVSAVDINPLMVLPRGRGVRAADALVVKRM